MPNIGKPQFNTKNKFSQITMKDNPVEQVKKIDKEILEKINGPENKSSLYTKKRNDKLGKDEFLKMLTFQLQNQDPLKPDDQKQFIAQLAQFSQLEQLAQMNKKMETSGENNLAQKKFYAASFIGKKVTTKGMDLNHDELIGSSMIRFSLDKPAAQHMIRIFDEQKNFVAEVKGDSLPRGMNSVKWEGDTLDGNKAGSGRYSYQVKAWDDGYQPINVETKASGIVSGIMFEDGKTFLQVDGKKISIAEIDSIEQWEPESNHSKQKIMNISEIDSISH